MFGMKGRGGGGGSLMSKTYTFCPVHTRMDVRKLKKSKESLVDKVVELQDQL